MCFQSNSQLKSRGAKISAALLVQRNWRDYVKLKVQIRTAQVNKDRTKKAAVLIQGYLRRNIFLEKKKKERERAAAICISSFFQRFFFRVVVKKMPFSTSIEKFEDGNEDSAVNNDKDSSVGKDTDSVMGKENKDDMNPEYGQDSKFYELRNNDNLSIHKRIPDEKQESTKCLQTELNVVKPNKGKNNSNYSSHQIQPSFLRHGDLTTQSLGGRRMRYMRCFSSNDDMMDTSKIVANEQPFQQLDPIKIGILKRREFSAILKQLWEESGHPLTVVEEEEIMKAFDCRDGFIDYKKYLRFAAQQFQPCLMHGRFVCTSPICTYIINRGGNVCPRAVNRSSKSKICKHCGDYIFSHTLLPNTRGYEKKKRGMKIFSQDNLMEKFAKPNLPDLEVEALWKTYNFSLNMATVQISNKTGKSKGKYFGIRCEKVRNQVRTLQSNDTLMCSNTEYMFTFL